MLAIGCANALYIFTRLYFVQEPFDLCTGLMYFVGALGATSKFVRQAFIKSEIAGSQPNPCIASICGESK